MSHSKLGSDPYSQKPDPKHDDVEPRTLFGTSTVVREITINRHRIEEHSDGQVYVDGRRATVSYIEAIAFCGQLPWRNG